MLTQAATKGQPELAYPAQQLLSIRTAARRKDVPNRKVGSERAYAGPMRKAGEDQPSHGIFRWSFDMQEHIWERYDYGDTLPMSKARAKLLGCETGTMETHCCFFLNLAGGLLWEELGQKPKISEAAAVAQQLLKCFQVAAEPAISLLGEPACLMPRSEVDVRVMLHDLFKPHHDIDYRLPAAFPLGRLRKFRLAFVRLDSQHRAALDTITGDKHKGQSDHVIWFWLEKDISL